MSATFTTAELNEVLPSLRRFALMLTRSEDRANDLVQDSVERALLKSHYFEPGTNLRSWMFTLCRRLFLNNIRKNKTRGVSVEFDDAPQATLSVAPNQEARVEYAQMQECFDRLPRRDREILSMVAIEGWKYDEAASALGVPIGTVRSRLSRARARLRDMAEGENRVVH